MATSNLSYYDPSQVPSGVGMKFALIVSEWNSDITFALRDGAVETLRKYGVADKDIEVHYVPGAYELTIGAKWLVDDSMCMCMICLGCVIQGETPHFDYICQSVANGLANVEIQSGLPIIFGVLTTLNKQQALDRAGGRLGNKGVEAAVAALKMVNWRKMLNAGRTPISELFNGSFKFNE